MHQLQSVKIPMAMQSAGRCGLSKQTEAEGPPRRHRSKAEGRRTAPRDERPATSWTVYPSGPWWILLPWQDIVHLYPAEADTKSSLDLWEAEGAFGCLPLFLFSLRHYRYLRQRRGWDCRRLPGWTGSGNATKDVENEDIYVDTVLCHIINDMDYRKLNRTIKREKIWKYNKGKIKS